MQGWGEGLRDEIGRGCAVTLWSHGRAWREQAIDRPQPHRPGPAPHQPHLQQHQRHTACATAALAPASQLTAERGLPSTSLCCILLCRSCAVAACHTGRACLRRMQRRVRMGAFPSILQSASLHVAAAVRVTSATRDLG